MSDHFRVGFRGEIVDGLDPADVRQMFAERFGKSDDAVERVFSGKPVTLAKDLSQKKAEDLARSLHSIGLVAHVYEREPVALKEPTVADLPEADRPSKPAADPQPEPDTDPLTMTQTVASGQAVIETVVETAPPAAPVAALKRAEPPAFEPAVPEEPEPLTAEAAEPVGDALSSTAKVRHVAQIMDGDPPPEADARSARAQRWRYRFDTFMARGGASIFKMLTAVFLVALAVIALLRGALLYFAPELPLTHEDIGFFGNLYVTFLELTDPGNMVQDLESSVWYKVLAVIAGLVGIVLLSALIAFITTALDQKINELKRGRSKVIEEDHTLILGWNEQRIVEILNELILANESESDACVVILANRDKEEIDDILRLRVAERCTTRVVTRSGDVSSLVNLDMVSLEAAGSVIILADCDDTDGPAEKAASDAKAIQTVLATMGRAAADTEFSIVVEIFNPTYRDIVRTTFPDNVVTVNTSDILAKLLVQTSRSVGLSVVYNEILSFDGCEMYFHEDEWEDVRFGDAVYRFPDGVPIGIRTADGEIAMNPDPNRRLGAGEEILIIADDDSTIEFRDQPVARPERLRLAERRGDKTIERELMIGWNYKSPCIVREFADYIIDGSQIDVLLKAPSDEQRTEIAALNDEIDNIEVRLVEKDCLDLNELMSIEPFTYDNIIILAGGTGGDEKIDLGRADSENIVALLLLRRIFTQYPDESRNTKLITEILDSQNLDLVARAGVQDVIISNRLVSMIMAQVSESRDIEKGLRRHLPGRRFRDLPEASRSVPRQSSGRSQLRRSDRPGSKSR